MDSSVVKNDDKLSPKFIWIVVAITIVLNIIICSIIYITANSTFVIKFNNGNQVLFELKATPGTDITSYNAAFSSKSGFSFDGWFLDDENFSLPYSFPEEMPSRNVIVYGKWSRIDYTITFDANGGKFEQDPVTTLTLPFESVLYDSLAEVSIPTYETKSFVGWAVRSDETSPIDQNYHVQARDVTLYAIWQDID